jgi:hypothetical protein
MLKTVSLLAILPALTFAFFIPFPVSSPSHSDDVNKSALAEHAHIENTNKEIKICSFVEYVDTVLCNGTDINHIKEFDDNIKKSKNNKNSKNEKSVIEFNLEMDPKNLCPLFELVDKSFCKSSKHIKVGTEKENIDPKDLCPLLELIETKLCS